MINIGSRSRAPWVIEFGKPSTRENLVMTSPYVRSYVRTDFAGRGKRKRILPLSPREFCPLLFQKPLEMIDKSESVNWPNIWWILGATIWLLRGLWVISRGKTHANKFLGEKYPAQKKTSLITYNADKSLTPLYVGEKVSNSSEVWEKIFPYTN